jgi:hypothetical protein
MTLFHDDGPVQPLALDNYTARQLVAATVLQAFRDVQALEKRQQCDPKTMPRKWEQDARHWLECESTAPFSYRWCCGVLGVRPNLAPTRLQGG